MEFPKDARIFIAGHRGLVGSAIVRRLQQDGFSNLLTATREQLDLRDQAAVNYWFRANRPEYVFLVAGTVGGILANSTRPAEFLYDNMMIHGTVVHAAHLYGVTRLLYLGSSCIYPRGCPQPMKEEHLLTGRLEPTNEPYAIAKIAGIKLCEAYRRQYGCDFISAMPTNLYGPHDNFDLESSHVLPAMIRKFHDARIAGQKEVVIWGTGSPRREFLHVDDLADACVYLMERYDAAEHINVGTGDDLSILELAQLVRDVVYPAAELTFDRSKPDGTPRKLLDVSRLHQIGWRHRIELRAGIASTYDWFVRNEAHQLA
ncbi:MAG TPA: GDP-L-fucose synthase [Vicinamibacterales bacterium]|nr:GDP-L-fucose synthase [Vicinamibacterales bacterium]